MMTMLDPDAIKVLFGQHLAEIRRDKKMSQEGLALESGLARSYLGGVERGKRNIALVNICKLAEALKVSPAELMIFSVSD
jgi:transcriptional regulator with XRE-family HTH domain